MTQGFLFVSQVGLVEAGEGEKKADQKVCARYYRLNADRSANMERLRHE